MSEKYSEPWPEREFVGYGLKQPHAKWPGGAKICVSFVVQYYMGAEASIAEGDETSCADYMEIPGVHPIKGRNESAEMMYEYGAREGVPRLLSLFSRYNMPVTWNIYTRALERAPYWVKPILDSGAEMSCGGHRYRDNFAIDPKEEDALITKSIDTLQALTGDKTLPHGWLVERRSNRSVKLYSQAHADRRLPLLYSSDSCSDDLPYWRRSPVDDGNGLLMVPFTYDTSDLRFNMRGSGWASPKDWFLYLQESFDYLLEEGKEGEPKMMTILLHPHIVGRASRTFWLEQFVKYISSKPDVWVARRMDIAEHWQKTYPYDSETAFEQTSVAPC